MSIKYNFPMMFCDRRKIKRIGRKKYITNREPIRIIHYSGDDYFHIFIRNEFYYAAEMIIIDKNKFLKKVKDGILGNRIVEIVDAMKSKDCILSALRTYTNLFDDNFIYFVFDNERSFIKEKLRS